MGMVAAPHDRHVSRRRALAGAVLTGAALGCAEAVRVAHATPLAWTWADRSVLYVVGTVTAALLAGGGTLPLLLATRALDGQPARRGALVAAGVLATVAGSIEWFTDPPPFTNTEALRGHPLVWGLACVSGWALLGALGLALRHVQRALAARVLGMVLAVGVVAVLAWGALPARDPSTTQPSVSSPSDAPNVLLVTLDTVRADRFGAYGADVDTRHFDRVAREGARFDRAVAVAPVTGPSHASMLMGAGPWDHGVLLNGVPLPERPLLAEVLRAHGWRTGAFVSAYVLDGGLGFRRGFEVYDDSFSTFRGVERLLFPRLLAMAGRAGSPDEVLERRAADTVEPALRWLREGPAPSERWLLWVHLFDPHGPYAPPPPWDTHYYSGDPTDPANTSLARATNVAPYQRRRLEGITDLNWVLAQYAGEVSYADTQLGRLLDAVEARGETARTLVAVIGDHGEALGEHGAWFNHGDDVHEESVRVPFALRLPGRVPAGTVVDVPVEGSDLAPTLLSLAGITPPSTMTGRPALGAEPRTAARALCFDREANILDRRAGRIDAPRWRMAGATTHALHAVLRERSGELHAEAHAASGRPVGGSPATPAGAPVADDAVRVLLDSMFAEAATARSAAATLSDEERARLEALGYLSPTGE
jgi:arylsulfatase A-like enzyme